MKKIFIIFIISLSTTYSSIAQNIVNNADFEENKLSYIKISENNVPIETYITQWKSLFPLFPCLYINYLLIDTSKRLWIKEKWVKPFKNNSFLEFTVFHNFINDTIHFYNNVGNEYLQASTYFSEKAIKQKLRVNLIKDTTYVISYRLQNKLHNGNYYYQNSKSNFGVHFSKNELPFNISPYRIGNLNPILQDRILDTNLRFRYIKVEYKADSNYEYIYIGHLEDNTNIKFHIAKDSQGNYSKNFYQFLDDVRLLPKWQYLDVTPDVNACQEDSVELKVISGAGDYKWAETNNPTTILSTTNTLKIKVADTNIKYQVMSPFDTALIPIYVTKFSYTYDTLNYKTCNNEPLKISVPNIYNWYDNSKDTTKTFTLTGNYWYQSKIQCTIKQTQIYTDINSPKYDTLKQTSCDSFIYKNTTYKNTGFYSSKYISYNLCDSFHTLELKINQSKTNTLNQFSCTPFKWNDSTYTQSGTYTRLFKTTNQCDSIVSLNLNIGLNSKVNLTNGVNYTSQQDSVSYQWYRCNPWRRITNETKRTFTTTTKGSYAVVLDNGKGCKDTSDCIALYSSGFATTTDAITRIYPNPFTTDLTIELDKLYNKINIKIYDLTGRLILNNNFQNNSTFIINNSTLSKGTYYLQIETENTNQFYNILKD